MRLLYRLNQSPPGTWVSGSRAGGIVRLVLRSRGRGAGALEGRENVFQSLLIVGMRYAGCGLRAFLIVTIVWLRVSRSLQYLNQLGREQGTRASRDRDPEIHEIAGRFGFFDVRVPSAAVVGWARAIMPLRGAIASDSASVGMVDRRPGYLNSSTASRPCPAALIDRGGRPLDYAVARLDAECSRS